MRVCYTVTAESAGERFLKIGQYLAKLWARVGCPPGFLTHGVYEPVMSILYGSSLLFVSICYWITIITIIIIIIILV